MPWLLVGGIGTVLEMILLLVAAITSLTVANDRGQWFVPIVYLS
jgi:hypothetical protein